MPGTVLSDVAADAERILNALLRGSVTNSVDPAAMGWVLYFAISSTAATVLRSDTLRLEHSCEEAVQISPGEPWSSDINQVESVLKLVLGAIVRTIRVAESGELQIFWECGAGLRLRSADYSLDWQWQFTTGEPAGTARFSVVSVHGGKVWTRYPPEAEAKTTVSR